ncbi:hypothetical protein Tdes44962_MAKER05556 [Teratosphaeria destructans]|uniref:Uncharacterized protein n=1 Tax=Teratosphaeria destructans TaxID=418781 RepID=A0A9W7SJL2_9PEZI|nr:hypothetical protein Tdes44962_MAKER05556 [Teratosphaeria destructans]
MADEQTTGPSAATAYDSDISEHTTYSSVGEGWCICDVESAYLDSPPTSKYSWHRQQVNYDFCSPKELKRFVVDRGLKDPYPEGITLKSLQEQVVMDLSASDVIHAINNVKIIIATNAEMSRDAEFVGHVQIGKQVYNGSSTYRFVPWTTGPSASLSIYGELRGCRSHCSLVSSANARATSQNINAWTCSRVCVLNLATFLMDGYRIKHLNIMLASTFKKSFAKELLFLLRRLRGIPRVSITGSDLDQSDIDSIRLAMGSRTPVFNTYRHFGLLDKEIKAWSALPPEFDDIVLSTKVSQKRPATNHSAT